MDDSYMPNEENETDLRVSIIQRQSIRLDQLEDDEVQEEGHIEDIQGKDEIEMVI